MPKRSLRETQGDSQTHDYRRNGTTNLYAALNVASGQVITTMTARHRAEEFKKFLDLIDNSVPEHLDVHVVLDNVSTHKTPPIQRWLQRHPRFTFHFTIVAKVLPASSSWRAYAGQGTASFSWEG